MPYNDRIVPLDDRLRDTLDRALAEVRANLEREIDGLAQRAAVDVVGVCADIHALDDARALTDALRILTARARRHVDRAVVVVLKDGIAPPPFAGGSSFPLSVGGRIVAVLYADVSDQTSNMTQWQAVLDILTRHTGRLLESMTLHTALGLVPPRAEPRRAEASAGQIR